MNNGPGFLGTNVNAKRCMPLHKDAAVGSREKIRDHKLEGFLRTAEFDVRDALRLHRGFSECDIARVHISVCNFFNTMRNLHAAVLKPEVVLAVNNDITVWCIFSSIRAFSSYFYSTEKL